ncbi:MAG: tetratricopeptide repeat protein [Nitrospirae bacterium]|nr:tetratricopeptide repeat protein [Nitrospirota bacterium]
MNKIIVVAVVSFIMLVTIGCRQQEQKQKQQQQQVTYTPAAPPVQFQVDRLEQAAKMAPKNAQVWIDLGNALMDAQRFSEAIDAYEKALALEPKNVPVLVDQGTCYRGVRKFDKAVEQYRKALKIEPNFPNGHRNLGVVLAYDLNKKPEAVKEFNRYLELAPNAPDAAEIRQTVRELTSGK